MVPRRKRKRATNAQRTELREQRVAADALRGVAAAADGPRGDARDAAAPSIDSGDESATGMSEEVGTVLRMLSQVQRRNAVLEGQLAQARQSVADAHNTGAAKALESCSKQVNRLASECDTARVDAEALTKVVVDMAPYAPPAVLRNITKREGLGGWRAPAIVARILAQSREVPQLVRQRSQQVCME